MSVKRFLILLLLLTAPAFTMPAVSGKERWVSAPHQTMLQVARQHGLALEHLAWANGLAVDPNRELPRSARIPTRRILPTSPPRDGVVVNIPERGLYLFRNVRKLAFYPAAIGKVGYKTPTGTWKIISKVKNPVWQPPVWAKKGEKPVPPGPKNPLGDRWIGLSESPGLHATNVPVSVGDSVTHSCTRMYPEHAAALYDKVYIGMPVRIEYETVRVGRDPHGKIVMAVFPDVYNMRAASLSAQRKIRVLGLTGRVSQAKVAALIKSKSGVPVRIEKS